MLGQPVAGNPTQYIMEKAFAKAGLDWRYLTLEVAPIDLADAVRGLRAMGFRGCNLTIPHKVAVIRHLNRLSEAAELMGAVNCVHRVGDELVGENTDGKGFVQSLRELADPSRQSRSCCWGPAAPPGRSAWKWHWPAARDHHRQSHARARRRTGRAGPRKAFGLHVSRSLGREIITCRPVPTW